MKGLTEQDIIAELERRDRASTTLAGFAEAHLDAEQLKTISTEELKQMVLSGEYRRVTDDEDVVESVDDPTNE